MIRYVSAFIVSMFLITPAIASLTVANVDNQSYDYINVVRADGSSVLVAPKQMMHSVPFRTRTTVSVYKYGQPMPQCQWQIRSAMIETLDSLVYNPENLIHGYSPCVKLLRN